MNMRIGQGFDAHRFSAGDHIIVGGVRIPHQYGIEAHSDGDVLLHAVTDALLGAAGAGDIGRHFPDTDPELKGIDSRRLLRKALEIVQPKRWRVVNVDATIIAQQPRLSPYITAMQANVAVDLQLPAERVNIKASTTERMGFVGREEGVAAIVSLLLAENND